MTETPERIWATHSETWGAVELGQWADTVRHKGGEEYVHHSLLDEAVKALADTLEWIDAVPSDTPLPAMPGFDRDEVDATLAKLRSHP